MKYFLLAGLLLSAIAVQAQQAEDEPREPYTGLTASTRLTKTEIRYSRHRDGIDRTRARQIRAYQRGEARRPEESAHMRPAHKHAHN